MKKSKRIKTTITEFIKEQSDNTPDTFIKTITHDGEDLMLHKVSDNPMKVLYYLDTMDGESYIDINTILEDNLLIDAIWVKIGGEEEVIADNLDFLEKTNKKTSSGYNKYIMYNITKKNIKNSFIEQTANDYDMPYSEVEWIYNKWNDKGLFYEKLEEYIKNHNF